MPLKWHVVLVSAILSSSCMVEAKKSQTKHANAKAHVGRFKISVEDNQIQDPSINETLFEALNKLYDRYYDTWNELTWNTTLPPDQEVPGITALANEAIQNLSDPTSKSEIGGLLATANESFTRDKEFLMTYGCVDYLAHNGDYCFDDIDVTLFPNNETSADIYMNESDWDLGWEYLWTVYNTTVLTDYFNQGALMGLGQSISCSEDINSVIESKNEWAKAASAVATTLMALLPGILAFGTFYVPRSSEVFATSTLVGLGSAVYNLGLPVQSMSVIPERQTLDLATLGIAALLTIASYGTMSGTDENGKRRKFIPLPNIQSLRNWSKQDDEVQEDERRDDINSDAKSQDVNIFHQISIAEAKFRFAEIRRAVNNWESRRHWWILPVIFFTFWQAFIFGFALAPLFASRGAPRFLFSCGTNWTGYYLTISACANAVFRLVMWETGYHERAKVYFLSPRARQELTNIIEREDNIGERDIHSVETELPPLYPPWYKWIRDEGAWLLLREPRMSDHKETTHKTRTGWRNAAYYIIRNPKQLWLLHRARFWHSWNYVKVTWNYIGRTASKSSSSYSYSEPNYAASRWRPLIILLHQNSGGRHKLKTFFTGFVESMLLLILTFFFAAQWGGNLKITTFAMVILLVFISVGRLLGFLYVYLSAKFWGLHVINCSSGDEITGSLRIICAMQGVLIDVNGVSYFNGYQLDKLGGYDNWRDSYEKGDYDRGDYDRSNIDFKGKVDNPQDDRSNDGGDSDYTSIRAGDIEMGSCQRLSIERGQSS